MNLTNLSHAYFILLICILNEIYGTRIPLEIVELESGTRISDDKIAANEYHTMDEIDSSSHDASEQNKSNGNANGNSNSNNVAGHDHNNEWRIRNRGGIRKITAEPRILYQVGSSEDDLPICGTNEVCSKIDLYGTPWIERQCRCPQPKHHHTIDDMGKNHVLNTRNRHAILHNLRLGDIGHNMYDFERENIKNFLMKLGMLHEMEENNSMNNDDYYESDPDDDDYSGDDHGQQSAIHSNSLKNQHHKNLDNEAIEIVKMTKIRHHGHSTQTNEHCSNSMHTNDGHTIADKTRLYKVCESVQKLPLCRYFRDYTWTLISYSDVNVTQQIAHCRCPRNSISYLIKREPLKNGAAGFTYLFACSPQSRLKCQRKEPCKLFTVRKRQEQLDEVNTNSLCQCPRNYRCPRLHTDAGVILGKSYIEDNIQTYSGYCMRDNQQ